ncbi:GxxExxY protein [Bowmanella denitrificans]|uniref:GxxExxY protein n=1 Tax=Bowmanella denitrificans TaxID=366582 RepID=UPI000C9A9EB8|nr:GxxExxY protein [Bowmanella denitrificans]
MDGNDLTGKIIGAAIEVHKALGPGLLESAYEACLEEEIKTLGLSVKRQLELPLRYRGIQVAVGYRIDLLVEDSVILELKTVDAIQPIHKAQLLTYLKLMNLRYGLLLNFNVEKLHQGICRILNG